LKYQSPEFFKNPIARIVILTNLLLFLAGCTTTDANLQKAHIDQPAQTNHLVLDESPIPFPTPYPTIQPTIVISESRQLSTEVASPIQVEAENDNINYDFDSNITGIPALKLSDFDEESIVHQFITSLNNGDDIQVLIQNYFGDFQNLNSIVLSQDPIGIQTYLRHRESRGTTIPVVDKDGNIIGFVPVIINYDHEDYYRDQRLATEELVQAWQYTNAINTWRIEVAHNTDILPNDINDFMIELSTGNWRVLLEMIQQIYLIDQNGVGVNVYYFEVTHSRYWRSRLPTETKTDPTFQGRLNAVEHPQEIEIMKDNLLLLLQELGLASSDETIDTFNFGSLMNFSELIELNRALNSTHDPIGIQIGIQNFLGMRNLNGLNIAPRFQLNTDREIENYQYQ
jgi:hypothetical protein